MGLLIAIIISIIGFGGVLGLLFYWRNRVGQMKLTKHDRSEIVTEDNTQSLLPFENQNESCFPWETTLCYLLKSRTIQLPDP